MAFISYSRSAEDFIYRGEFLTHINFSFKINSITNYQGESDWGLQTP